MLLLLRHSLQHEIGHDIGCGQQVISTFGENPGSHDLIQGAKKAIGKNAILDFFSKYSHCLALANYFPDDIQIIDDVLLGEFFDKVCALPQLCLHHDGEISVRTETTKMMGGNGAQLLPGISLLRDCSLYFFKKAVKGAVQSLTQDLFFAFEVQVDSSIRDAGSGGNFAHPRVEKTIFSKNLDGCFQNALALIGISGCSGVQFWSRICLLGNHDSPV